MFSRRIASASVYSMRPLKSSASVRLLRLLAPILALGASCAAPPRFSGALSGPPRWDLDARYDDRTVFGNDLSTLQILGRDLAAAPRSIVNDVRSTVTTQSNWPLLGGAIFGGLVIENSGLNRRFRRDEFEAQDLSRATSDALDRFGTGSTLFGIGAGLYGWGLATRNPRLYRAGRTGLATMAATGVLTTLMKAAVNDPRPNGGDYGYPSGHTSMSVALGTSLHSSYGWKVSLPVFTLAGLVAYQRLDSGAHDLDDVFVGAVLGFVTARQVHNERGLTFLGARVAPFYDPAAGGGGLSLTWTY